MPDYLRLREYFLEYSAKKPIKIDIFSPFNFENNGDFESSFHLEIFS